LRKKEFDWREVWQGKEGRIKRKEVSIKGLGRNHNQSTTKDLSERKQVEGET